jgi:hypothetical protein
MSDYKTFNICLHYASAIVNGDYSGLEDHEEIELNNFLNELTRRYGSHELNLLDYYCESNFALCEVSNLMGDCVKVDLIPA